MQRGGFVSERDAAESLERALDRVRRANGIGSTLTLAALVDEVWPSTTRSSETIEKLRWLLAKAMSEFGDQRLGQLRSQEIAAWRMTIPAGHRFEATQALRQILGRAVEWRMIDVNPAKHGVDNPQRRRTEKRPFELWARLAEVASRLGERERALVIFAAATGLRPGEWIALEQRDIDRDAVSSTCGGRSATDGSSAPRPRAASAPCRSNQSRSTRLNNFQPGAGTDLLFQSLRGAYFDLHNFRTHEWKPAQLAAGITPIRRDYDLRHTFATFALRAGVSTFDLSRYMVASLTMIDRHYGHLARDGRDHAINLLDTHASADEPGVHRVDIAWTRHRQAVATTANGNSS